MPSREGDSTRGRRSLGLASSLVQCVVQREKAPRRWRKKWRREPGQLHSPLQQEPGSIFSSWGVADGNEGRAQQVINALSVFLPMFCRSGASQEESKAGGECCDLQLSCVYMLTPLLLSATRTLRIFQFSVCHYIFSFIKLPIWFFVSSSCLSCIFTLPVSLYITTLLSCYRSVFK